MSGHTALYLSASQSYREGMSLESLKEAMLSGWRGMTPTKMRRASIAVAFVDETAMGAWNLIDAYPTDSGKASLVLGAALPISRELTSIPSTRRGMALVNLSVSATV